MLAEILLSEVVYNGNHQVKSKNLSKNLKFRRDATYSQLSNASPKNVSKASKLIKSRKDNDYEEDYRYFIPKELMEIKEEE